MAQKVGDAYVDIGARFDKLDKAVHKMDSRMNRTFKGMESNLGSTFKNLGGVFAGAFAVDRIVAFTKEAVELAGVAEGVSKAFNRMADPSLMKELKEATRGTVSELELMKAVTTSSNFGIALDSLPPLLEFARRRAKEMGEEVDVLTEKIVRGIGRKSVLILDDLGISASQIKDQLGGVSVESASVADVTKAVGEIAKEAYSDFEEGAATSAEKAAQLEAKLQDVTVEVGQNLTGAFNTLRTSAIGVLELINKALTTNADEGERLAQDIFDSATREGRNTALAMEELGLKLSGATQKLAELKAEQDRLTNGTWWERNSNEALIDLPKINDEVEKYTSLISALGHKLTGYINEQQNANTTTDETVKQLTRQKQAVEGLIVSLDKLNFAQGAISANIKNLTPDQIKMAQGAAEMGNQYDMTTYKLRNMKDTSLEYQEVAGALHGVFNSLGAVIASNMGQATTAAGAFGQAFLKGAIDLVSQMLAVSLASSIAGATQSGAATGPAALFTTPAFIAQAIGTVLGAFAAIPAFASGGQSRGGMALVGERGPELVNLAKGSMITPNHQMHSAIGAGNRQKTMLPVEVGGVLRGSDIYLSNERGARRRSR